MPVINKIHAREILDSRGNPTVEADLFLDNQFFGRAAVPSGASTGQFEALELRDEDNTRFNGKGTLKAVHNINCDIVDAICGKEFRSWQEVDKALLKLDSSSNKSKLGANAVLAVSLAAAKAFAAASGKPLYKHLAGSSRSRQPQIMVNIINGGAHANNKLQLQEFMIVPRTGTIEDDIRLGAEVFHALGKILSRHGYSTTVGDEGGYGPNLSSHEEALDLICQASESAGGRLGDNISLCLDAAASEFYHDGKYQLIAGKTPIAGEGLISYYQGLIRQYPIISIEDPMAEDDYTGWQAITAKLGKEVMLVGDDLFVTNTKLLQQGIEKQLANAVLIKLNQIGSLSETMDAVKLARKAGYKVIISHRSGETEDTTIAHLAVAVGAEYIKTGSLCRSERVAKYNELLRINEML